jgi:hypothetical protein
LILFIENFGDAQATQFENRGIQILKGGELDLPSPKSGAAGGQFRRRSGVIHPQSRFFPRPGRDRDKNQQQLGLAIPMIKILT